jgi:hypothetical protein
MFLMFSVVSGHALGLQWHLCCLEDSLAISLVLYANYVCGWPTVLELVMCLFLMSWCYHILCCPASRSLDVCVASGFLPFAHG